MFQEYTKLIENTLDQQLQARIPGFSMKAFETVLSERKGTFTLLLHMIVSDTTS